MNTTLSAERVNEIFVDCLFKKGEEINDHVEVEGIITKAWLKPARLENHKAEIEALLDELPSVFKKSEGGGMSFLSACMDKHGTQWAEHPTMEMLFMLGIAIGKVELVYPREMWPSLPGGMPCYAVI